MIEKLCLELWFKLAKRRIRKERRKTYPPVNFEMHVSITYGLGDK